MRLVTNRQERLGYESFEKFASGHCEAHVRRGNLFNNQCFMRLLRRPLASSQRQIGLCAKLSLYSCPFVADCRWQEIRIRLGIEGHSHVGARSAAVATDLWIRP